MAAQSVTVFDDGDEPYFKWLAQQEDGFVINAERNKNSDTMVLHRATCRTIRIPYPPAQPGGFTERDYIKVCSLDIESLRAWVGQHGQPGGWVGKVCARCRPG